MAIPFAMEQLEWCVATDGEKCLVICLAVSVEYQLVADRRTDRQTDILRQHSPRYA